MMGKKWNYDTCFDLAKTCKTRSELKVASNRAYTIARENGWLKDYIWLDSRDRKAPNYWNSYENCKKEANNYSSINDFTKGNSAAATQARKNGWMNDFFEYKCKPRGYWNNYDRCLKIASECQTRSEFSKRKSAAYKWSLKNGWIDIFDWLVDERIHNGNKVDCIYVYEFEEYNSAYIGMTLMRRKNKRDYEHRNARYIDKNGNEHQTIDSVFNFSTENSCQIPKMKILEENLTIAEGRDREGYWVSYYKDNGWVIINKAKTGPNSSSLGALGKGKWTYDACKDVALSCASLSEFKRLNGAAYEASRLNGWLKDYSWFVNTSELISTTLKNVRDKDRIWTRDKCYELALTCKTSSEFQSKSGRAYAVSKEYGWFDDYTWFVSGFSLIGQLKWTKDACIEIALNCKTKTEFKNKNSSAYVSACKNGWLDDYYWFVDGNMLAREKRRKYTYEKCYEIASSCNTASEFKSVSPSAYLAARTNKWLKDYVWFTNGRRKDRKWTNEILKQEAAKYIHERDFMLGSNIAYRKARNNNKLNDLFSNMRFNFKGYFDVSGFELKINSDIHFEKYKYIVFSSTEAQKAIYKFYKEEMQQGQGVKVPNLGSKFIEQTGFYELFPKNASWEKFKNEICPIVLYSFEIKDNVIWITPLNVNGNKDIYTENKDIIFKL